MAIREGMTKIIALLRHFGYAAEDDIELNGVWYWSDEQLEEIADRHSDIAVIPLKPAQVVGLTLFTLEKPKSYYAEDNVYVDNVLTVENILVYDENKAKITTAFVYDTNTSRLTFASGLASNHTYYAQCNVVNLNRALAELWGTKAAQRSEYIDFKAGDQSMSHSQEAERCLRMQAHYRSLTITRLPRTRVPKWSI